jgi:hypothetical protein
MELEGSLPCSQEVAIGTRRGPYESRPHSGVMFV